MDRKRLVWKKTIEWINSKKYFNKLISKDDNQKLLLGKILAKLNNNLDVIKSINEVEFKVFSQWGDDGIIQYLINHINIPNKIFVEFGVETYHESNTRFLLMNNNWSGLVIDGSKENIKAILSQDIYWKFDIIAKPSFITAENINGLIDEENISGDIGLLSIDLDGNDYWVLDAIEVIQPVILIIEYNSVFGNDRFITIPYNPDFDRTEAHYSNLYWGASLPALHYLATKKGYTLIGCNSNGNNAYFVRNDNVSNLPAPTLKQAFVESKYKESRDKKGALTYLKKDQRANIIKGLAVINVQTKEEESF